MPALRWEFSKRPSTLGFMLRALLPSPGLRAAAAPAGLELVWHGHHVSGRDAADFLGIIGAAASERLPIVSPHVFGFPLEMAALTHPAYPLPLWRALQVRNQMRQHRPVPIETPLELATRVLASRVLEKGAEIDLGTTLRAGADLVWDSVTSYYYRGRYGAAGLPHPCARPPAAPERVIAAWRAPSGNRWRFCRLTAWNMPSPPKQ